MSRPDARSTVTPAEDAAGTDPDGQSADGVTFYWRPGCVFCLLLRRELDHAGISRQDVNIWNDPVGAARVRDVAEGYETVPTVIVGDEALVNPGGEAVRELVARRAPHLISA